MFWFQVIRNNETLCISISYKDLVTGNNVTVNNETIYTTLLLSKINIKVLILKRLIEVPMKES